MIIISLLSVKRKKGGIKDPSDILYGIIFS